MTFSGKPDCGYRFCLCWERVLSDGRVGPEADELGSGEVLSLLGARPSWRRAGRGYRPAGFPGLDAVTLMATVTCGEPTAPSGRARARMPTLPGRARVAARDFPFFPNRAETRMLPGRARAATTALPGETPRVALSHESGQGQASHSRPSARAHTRLSGSSVRSATVATSMPRASMRRAI